MFRLLTVLLLSYIINAKLFFDVTNKVQNKNELCNVTYVLKEKNDAYMDMIYNLLGVTYSNNIIFKFRNYTMNVVATLIHNEEKSCELFCDNSKLLYISTDPICDIGYSLHSQIYHMINYISGMTGYDEEFEKLNKHKYIGDDYKNNEKKEGFISRHSMRSANDDKASLFAEFMSYDKIMINNKKYDDIIIKKFKLLFNRLIGFDSDFKKIIDDRNNELDFIFGFYDDNNSVRKYILSDNEITYNTEDDEFISKFNVNLANQKEKERYNSLIKNFCKSIDSQIKLEQLIFMKDLKNKNGHIFGMIKVGKEYKLPSYKGSPVKRMLLYKFTTDVSGWYYKINISLTNNIILLDYSSDNKATNYNNLFVLCGPSNERFMIVDIHFTL